MQYWLLKTEPETYSFSDLVREGTTVWDGVRNHQAKANLDRMGKGDQVLIYHTGKERSAVGRGFISRAAYPDPTDPTDTWLAVDVTATGPLACPVALKTLRQRDDFVDSTLLTAPRLSVVPIPPPLWEEMLRMSETGQIE